MSRFVIDSYAWIEYFEGSEAGKRVKTIIENKENKIFTSLVNVSEIMSIFKRRGYDFEEAYKLIISLSGIHPSDCAFAKEAGLLHAEIKTKNKHFSLADAFVLLTARKLNAKILTGDEDFRGIKEAVLIK
jgi:predicted nucleic acid-binding protein